MIPVTYFPVPTQRQFAKNPELIRGKPYKHYFNGDLWLHDDVLPALRLRRGPRHEAMAGRTGQIRRASRSDEYAITKGPFCSSPAGGSCLRTPNGQIRCGLTTELPLMSDKPGRHAGGTGPG